MLGRMGLVLSLVMLATAIGGASSAQAATVTCEFTNLYGVVFPPIPALVPGPVVAGGVYNASGPANCFYQRGSIVLLPEADGRNAVISTQGRYDSVGCSSGTWADVPGTGTVIDFDPAAFPDITSFPYTILFGSGHGRMSITGGPAGYQGGGVVQMTPAGSGNCVTQPLAEFTWDGSFNAVGPPFP